MIDNHELLQEMIDITKNRKKLSDTTYFSNLTLDEFLIRKRSIPSLLAWFLFQDFPDNPEITKRHGLSNKPVIQLISESPELQKYFQIRGGSLTFADNLSQEDALGMFAYVRQNYKPTVIFN